MTAAVRAKLELSVIACSSFHVQVTGGGNGLGRGICLKLAEHGCNVAVADLNLDAANAVVDEIKRRGLKAKAYKVDVTQAEEIKKLRDELCNDLGPVDILVSVVYDYKTHWVVDEAYFCLLFQGQQCRFDVQQKFGRLT